MDKDSLNRSLLVPGIVLIFGIVMTLLIPSCTIAKHPTAGFYASLGGNTKDYRADSEGFGFDANNNSKGLESATKLIGNAIVTLETGKTARNLTNQAAHTTRVIDNNAVRIRESDNAVQTTKITEPLRAETEQARIAAESAQQ